PLKFLQLLRRFVKIWRPWRKSSVKIHDTYSPTATASSFSFKDIHHLCTDDSSSLQFFLTRRRRSCRACLSADGTSEEVKQLHEIGELKKLVQELPRIEPRVCEMCGGHRFVPCNVCHGSHKVHTEKLGFRTCSTCNENGLVRCSSCLFVSASHAFFVLKKVSDL
ncbi:hypothetical protein HID58_087987, partial [Brassica napus]